MTIFTSSGHTAGRDEVSLGASMAEQHLELAVFSRFLPSAICMLPRCLGWRLVGDWSEEALLAHLHVLAYTYSAHVHVPYLLLLAALRGCVGHTRKHGGLVDGGTCVRPIGTKGQGKV